MAHNTHRRLTKALLRAIFALCIVAPVPAFATPGEDDLERLLTTGASAERYRGVGETLRELVASADADGLPSAVLAERIREGAAKSASPQALVAGGRLELDRLRSVADLLKRTGVSPGHDPGRVYGMLTLCLRAGLSLGSLEILLRDGGVDGLERSVAACEALLKLIGITGLEEAELIRLGQALLRGRVPPSGYGSVAAVFAKARAARLDDARALELIATVLERGGGMLQVNDAINAAASRGTRLR